jgi:hypothetical protein
VRYGKSGSFIWIWSLEVREWAELWMGSGSGMMPLYWDIDGIGVDIAVFAAARSSLEAFRACCN